MTKNTHSPKIITIDGRCFCKSKLPVEPTTSSTYIWVEPFNHIETNHGWFKTKGLSRYIGFTKTLNIKKIKQCRPFLHKKSDLLSKTILNNWICYCIINLTEVEARCLEALFIKQSDLKLSKKDDSLLESNCLINKRREIKYEDICDKYLDLENQWK